MIMNKDDARRYEWLRAQFTPSGLKADGMYFPILRFGKLPLANSLDKSIDKAMGVTPTHEPLEPVFTVNEVAEMLLKNCNGYLWIGDEQLELPYRDEIKSAILKLKGGE